jgi:hypothetical protein
MLKSKSAYKGEYNYQKKFEFCKKKWGSQFIYPMNRTLLEAMGNDREKANKAIHDGRSLEDAVQAVQRITAVSQALKEQENDDYYIELLDLVERLNRLE